MTELTGADRKQPPIPTSPPPYLVGHAEVLYEYDGTEKDDLTIKPGQIIGIIEFVNQDWWRGKNDDGEQGIFPSNYVKLVKDEAADHQATESPNAAIKSEEHSEPLQGYYNPYPDGQQTGPPAQYHQYQQQPQYQMQQQPQYEMQQQQQYPMQQQQQYPMQQQPQYETQQQQSSSANRKKWEGVAGNIGGRFLNSAIFGAGATVGSDLVHKIGF